MVNEDYQRVHNDDDHGQTSSDLSRIVFLTWCDKHNIEQFSSIRFPSGCVGDGICSLLLCEFIKRISARALLSDMLIKSSVHHSINIQKEWKFNSMMRRMNVCCVQLTLYRSIERRLIRVCVVDRWTILLSFSVNQPWCKSNLLLFSASLYHTHTPLWKKRTHVPLSFLSSYSLKRIFNRTLFTLDCWGISFVVFLCMGQQRKI